MINKYLFVILLLSITAISCNSENKEDQTGRFTDQEVVFTNGANELHGTLTIPAGDGPFPAVLLITGSGLQNRDEEITGFKPFKVIAEKLAQNGIAVLRYDDRGFGKSKGEAKTATTRDFADDAAAGIKFLKSRPEIDKNKVGAFGHSEGGAIVAMLGADPVVAPAFCIMMAGPAVRGDTIINSQLISINRAQGVKEADLATIIDFQNKVYNYVRNYDLEKDSLKLNELHKELIDFQTKAVEYLPESMKKSVKNPAVYGRFLADNALKQLLSPWFKYFISCNPSDWLVKVKVPVLALFGGKDIQVPAALNIPALKESMAKAGNNDCTIELLPDANHLFQKANTGQVEEYSTLKKEFCDKFLDIIADWVKEKTK